MRIVTNKKKSYLQTARRIKKKRWWSFDSDQTVEKAPFHSLPSDAQQQNYLFCCFQSSCYPVLSLRLSIEICSSTIDQRLSSDGSVWAEVDTHPVLVLLFFINFVFLHLFYWATSGCIIWRSRHCPADDSTLWVIGIALNFTALHQLSVTIKLGGCSGASRDNDGEIYLFNHLPMSSLRCGHHGEAFRGW